MDLGNGAVRHARQINPSKARIPCVITNYPTRLKWAKMKFKYRMPRLQAQAGYLKLYRKQIPAKDKPFRGPADLAPPNGNDGNKIVSLLFL